MAQIAKDAAGGRWRDGVNDARRPGPRSRKLDPELGGSCRGDRATGAAKTNCHDDSKHGGEIPTYRFVIVTGTPTAIVEGVILLPYAIVLLEAVVGKHESFEHDRSFCR